MVGQILAQIRHGGPLRERALRLKDSTNDLLLKSQLRRNHIQLSFEHDSQLRAIIAAERQVSIEDTEFEMNSRLRGFRNTVVPWLDDNLDFRNLHILEVGCGSGAATIAMAEQGAKVIGIDVDPRCLRIGKERIKYYDLDAEMHLVDGSGLPTGRYNLIIFFASLEHMTQEERLRNLAEAWNMLPTGGYLCVVETPNRLWFYDDHTSALPFFDWLPDSLALRYSPNSPKLAKTFGGLPVDDVTLQGLARSGRGMSYHEFEVAGIPCREVESCMVEYLMRNPLYWGKFHLTQESTFSRIIRKQAEHINKAFFYHRLDLLIKKS